MNFRVLVIRKILRHNDKGNASQDPQNSYWIIVAGMHYVVRAMHGGKDKCPETFSPNCGRALFPSLAYEFRSRDFRASFLMNFQAQSKIIFNPSSKEICDM